MPFSSTDETGLNGSTFSHPQWRAMLDFANEGIWAVDVTGTCSFVNRTATQILGFTQEEMLGKHMHVLAHHHQDRGSRHSVEDCPLHKVLKNNQPLQPSNDTMFRKDGSTFPAKISAQPVAINGAVIAALVVFHDVSDQGKLQQELNVVRETAERRRAELDAVLENVSQAIFVASKEGDCRLNDRAREMTGETFPAGSHTLYSALRGVPSTETICIPAPSVESSSGVPSKRWIRSVAAPVLVNGQILGGVAINTDITQLRLQEDVLRKAEKLAAAGQLASSIAHEINNPLEAITNLLYLVRHSSNMDEVQEYATQAQSELARVTEITLQTLKFHRQQSKLAWTELSELIDAILLLYTGRFLVRGIEVRKRLVATPPAFCHEGEIRQVLNNLVRNAVDALGRGGKLAVRLRSSSNDVNVRGVRITIADSGEGISPDIAGHLFEPFRTTKEFTGTGLGLWVTKGIVEKHGGKVSVRTRRSEPSGTVFSLWLPVDGSASLSGSGVEPLPSGE